jgi:hypothetical protein
VRAAQPIRIGRDPFPAGLDGIAVAEALCSELPECASVIVTSHGRPGHLKRALAAGVRGFLPKTVSAHVLAEVVRGTHSGGRYVDPELAAAVHPSRRSPTAPPSPGTVRNTYPPRPPNSAPPTATKPSTSPAPTAGYDAGLPHPKRHSPLGPATDGSHDELHVEIRAADPL